jgi:hypothetical protein
MRFQKQVSISQVDIVVSRLTDGALKTGLNIAGYVEQGRNIEQAAKSRNQQDKTYSRKLWTR